MMQYKTEKGTVTMDSNVFSMIALETALRREEIFAVTNARGKRIRTRGTGRENLGFIEVGFTEKDDEIDLRIYVILNFGKSIRTVAKEFGREVRESIRDITGISVRNLTMVVTGVKSRKIARRELEIIC